MKLWCDEAGRWWLTEVQPTTAGALVLSESATITEGTDTMSVASEVWFDAVVVTYKWTDSFDLNNTAYDVAGPAHPRNVYLVDTTPVPRAGRCRWHPEPGAGTRPHPRRRCRLRLPSTARTGGDDHPARHRDPDRICRLGRMVVA